MKYRHIKTGAIIDTFSELSGGWERVDTTPAPAESIQKPKNAPAQPKKRGVRSK